MKITAPAGMIDHQFGTTSLRSLPPLIVVELTSTYSASTGYSWTELRSVPGTGLVTPDNPLTGDLAYDITGNTNLTPGTRCAMSIDRDQTTYVLWFVVGFGPNGGGGSGSGGSGSGGSGSGGDVPGCGDAVPTVDVECTNGAKVITVRSIGIGFDGNNLVVEECSSDSAVLGPCSPTNPAGTTIPAVTSVCPTKTTLTGELLQAILDGDVTLDVVTGLTAQRRLVVVPIADVQGCIEDPEECCSGSGSGGSGSTDPQCVTTCDQCPDAMSREWEIYFSNQYRATLYHVTEPDDGNYCRFVSDDLRYDLRYDYDAEVWVLTKDIGTETETVWVDSGWRCAPPDTPGEGNFMVSAEGDIDAELRPVYECGDQPPTMYACSEGSGTCYEDPAGEYETLAECLAACSPVAGCCGCAVMANRYSFTVSGVTSSVTDCDGNCDDLNGSWTVTWTSGCTWTSGDAGTCSAGEATWTLTCTGSDVILTTACTAGINAHQWSVPLAQFQCLGTTVMEHTQSGTCCTDGIPATITVTAG